MVISIEQATYKGGYKIEFTFSDGEKKLIDFEQFLTQSINPMTSKYLDKEKFQAFSIDFGEIVWNDYELCFPTWDLHEGKI